MKRALLDARLRSAAKFVRAESVLADIGTDHGYLPVFLLSEGRVRRAVLSDINEGPLSSARENAEASGLSHLCEFYLTDGCHALSGLGVTDYAVCGMGGELIAEIIEHAPHLKDPAVRLILQPMSRPEQLRAYLAAEGIDILSETFVQAAGKAYVCIHAAYSGVPYALSPFSEEFGLFPDIKNEAFLSYLYSRERAVSAALRGMMQGSESCESLSALLLSIQSFKEENRLGETL